MRQDPPRVHYNHFILDQLLQLPKPDKRTKPTIIATSITQQNPYVAPIITFINQRHLHPPQTLLYHFFNYHILTDAINFILVSPWPGFRLVTGSQIQRVAFAAVVTAVVQHRVGDDGQVGNGDPVLCSLEG